MAKEKEKLIVEEEPTPMEDIPKPSSRTQAKKNEIPKERYSLTQYFNQFRSDVHEYTRAYVGASYHDIIMTKDEWEIELKGKL
jgi:hypothetical protein